MPCASGRRRCAFPGHVFMPLVVSGGGVTSMERGAVCHALQADVDALSLGK
ncbi:MAG: hypothetical protein GY820_19960 [Gammaproteobacteria bacterium]|nr:hypothetical protein [Gammaproteobacteria bacterium]